MRTISITRASSSMGNLLLRMTFYRLPGKMGGPAGLCANMASMSIGELAKLSGIPASTIRYWERIGVLPRAPRVSGRRRYPPDAIHRLGVLRFARACGFDLAQMRELFFGFREGAPPTERWLELGRRKRAEIDARIAQLTAMRSLVDRVLRCRCVDLEECGRRIAAAG